MSRWCIYVARRVCASRATTGSSLNVLRLVHPAMLPRRTKLSVLLQHRCLCTVCSPPEACMYDQDEGEQVQKVELASYTPLVQSLSMNLYQNAAVVVKVEAWISELGAVPQGPSSLRLRDAVTWEVIARVDHGRNSYQAVQRVCPEHCVDDTVWSSPTPQAALLLVCCSMYTTRNKQS